MQWKNARKFKKASTRELRLWVGVGGTATDDVTTKMLACMPGGRTRHRSHSPTAATRALWQIRNKKPGHKVRGLCRKETCDQASMSAQILRAQLLAKIPSVRLASADKPPEPATVTIVFCAAS